MIRSYLKLKERGNFKDKMKLPFFFLYDRPWHKLYKKSWHKQLDKMI